MTEVPGGSTAAKEQIPAEQDGPSDARAAVCEHDVPLTDGSADSGLAEHRAKTGVDLVAAFEPELATLWDDPATTRRFCMPVVLEARRL